MQNLFEKLNQKEMPKQIVATSSTRGVVAVEKKVDGNGQNIDLVSYVMSQSRAFRRDFARKYGLKVPGSAKPIINAKKRK